MGKEVNGPAEPHPWGEKDFYYKTWRFLLIFSQRNQRVKLSVNFVLFCSLFPILSIGVWSVPVVQFSSVASATCFIANVHHENVSNVVESWKPFKEWRAIPSVQFGCLRIRVGQSHGSVRCYSGCCGPQYQEVCRHVVAQCRRNLDWRWSPIWFQSQFIHCSLSLPC